MTKLNQIIAVEPSIKTNANKAWTEAYKDIQKPALFTGISRTYKPIKEDGDQLPAESTLVQLTVNDLILRVAEEIKEIFDITATKDWSNCLARADVKTGDRVLLEQVPVTFLLFLEKQLTDLHTFVGKLPVLDPAIKWNFDDNINAYRSAESETIRSKKELKVLVKAEATDKHPAQTETYTEEVAVGTWTKTEFSGAIPKVTQLGMLARVEELQRAVKFAREEANSLEIEQKKIGISLLQYVFNL